VVVATHDPEVVELCDRVVRLVDGRPVEEAPDAPGHPLGILPTGGPPGSPGPPGRTPPDPPGEAGGPVA
jgi:hypothetical protein